MDGTITVGGFSTASLSYLEGILLGTTESLARNTASVCAPPAALARWAEEQADIIKGSRIPPTEQLTAAGIVIACGGDPGKLPVAHMGARYLNQFELEAILRTRTSLMIYIGEPNFEEDRDDCHPREFKSSFRVAQNILFLGELAPPYSNTKPWWPGKPSYWSILESILRRRWKMYKKDMATDVIVGRVGEIEILREVDVVRRRP